MAVLVVDTDRRRQIPSKFLWVMQGLAKGGKELYTLRELGEMINGSRRNRNVKSSSVKSRAADFNESRHAFDWGNSYWSIRKLTGVPTAHRGQYSDAVLSELENQNDAEVEGISAKVKMLKDVSYPLPSLSSLSPLHPLKKPFLHRSQ